MPYRLLLLLAACFGLAPLLAGAEARIVKVLPQWTDLKGRTSLSPSLFERDAYQDHLRHHPDQVGGIRFRVLTRGMRAAKADEIVVHLRTANRQADDPVVVRVPIKAGSRSRLWTAADLQGPAFREAGRILAWRVVVKRGDEEIASQASFLW